MVLLLVLALDLLGANGIRNRRSRRRRTKWRTSKGVSPVLRNDNGQNTLFPESKVHSFLEGNSARDCVAFSDQSGDGLNSLSSLTSSLSSSSSSHDNKRTENTEMTERAERCLISGDKENGDD